MIRTCRLGMSIVLAGLALAAGCGDDDDAPSGNGGSSTGGVSAKGGSTSTGGATSGGSAGEGGSEEGLECEVLGELCHAVDDKSGPLHECHEVGHVGEPRACKERFSSCVHQCIATPGSGDGGTSGVGGASGTVGGAGAEAADPYCAALGELCHAVDEHAGLLKECHNVGHSGDPSVCRARFGECATACLAAREEEESGGGGHGGEGHAHAGAGQGGSGGAAGDAAVSGGGSRG